MGAGTHIVRGIFSPLQHDRAHSLRVSIVGTEFRICARCTGIYTGLVTAFLIGLVAGFGGLFSATGTPVMLGVSTILCAPLLFDWSMSKLGLKKSDNKTRVATGALFGAGMIIILFASMQNLFFIAIPLLILLFYIIPVILLTKKDITPTEKNRRTPTFAVGLMVLFMMSIFASVVI
jgi:uncharacterized membrane protein